MEETPPTDSAAAAWIKRNSNYVVLAIVFALFVFPRISPWDGLNDQLGFVQRFSEWSLRKLEELFSDYGYYLVFFGVLLENSMFLGLLVPGAIILILAGLSAENGAINIWAVFALAMLATIIGDTISYMIGRFGWSRRLERTGMGKLIERVREPMESNSTWLILAYHMAGYSRVVGPLAAGLFRIPYRRWAPLDYTGGAIWVVTFTMLGVFLGLGGVEFGDTKRMVQLLEYFFFGLFAVGVTIAILRSQRGSRGSSGGPKGDPMHGRPAVIPVEDRD